MHFRSVVHAVTILAFGVTSIVAAECQAGTWSKNGQSPCQACPAGTFASQRGSLSCQEAQAGWFAPGPGATVQQICAQGTYSTGGAASCTPCPPGSYCNGQGRTSPQACEPGRFSASPGAGQDCENCPKGTFNNINGATGCCQCCSGWYNDQTGQTHCFNCPNRGPFQQGWSPAGSSSASACVAQSGALASCSQSDSTCPATGGASPSGIPQTNPSKRRNMPMVLRPPRCSKGFSSCPVYGVVMGHGFLKSWQCIDTNNALETCGGCVNQDSPNGEVNVLGGRDCSAIPNVDSVRCQVGKCIIESCLPGYLVSGNGDRCRPFFG